MLAIRFEVSSVQDVGVIASKRIPRSRRPGRDRITAWDSGQKKALEYCARARSGTIFAPWARAADPLRVGERQFMTQGTVGFIGLGLMGQGFTRRLGEKGYRVFGFDIDAAKTKAAAQWGVTPAKNAAEVAQACDIILVSVMNPASVKSAVEDVALGPNGIVAAGRGEGKILVDHSTTDLDA